MSDIYEGSIPKWYAELTAAHAEGEEQSRLLGMSGSREAKLIAELAAAKAEIDRFAKRPGYFYEDCEQRDREIKRLREALDDIANFHDKDFDEIEKRHGFLGWTCCGQTRHIAQSALDGGKA